MQYELQDSLGLQDARKCVQQFGATLDLESPFKKGDVIDLNQKSAEYLTGKYKALLKPAAKVSGQAKDADVKAPAK